MDDDELAFYDAVAQNQSAVEGQGEDVLAQIARELVTVLRRDIRTDSTVRDDGRCDRRLHDRLSKFAPCDVSSLELDDAECDREPGAGIRAAGQRLV